MVADPSTTGTPYRHEPADVVKNSTPGGFTMKTVVLDDATHQKIKDGAALGGARRHDPRTYARSIVKKWPALAEETRAELRAILAPITALTADSDGGQRADG
jgi:hypothetical protein